MTRQHIYSAMADVQTQCTGLVSASLDTLHAQVLSLLTKNSLICLSSVLATGHTVSGPNGELMSLTTVDAEFEFIADDASSVTCRATGIYEGHDLRISNTALIRARMQALLQVFYLTTDTGAVVAAEPMASAVVVAKAAVQDTMQKAGLAGAVTTADKLPEKSVPAIPPVRPAASNLPATPSLQQAKAQALSPEAKAVAEWMIGMHDLNPEAPGEWNVYLSRMKAIPGLTQDERKDLFNKLRKEAKSLGIEYDADPNKLRFYLPELA